MGNNNLKEAFKQAYEEHKKAFDPTRVPLKPIVVGVRKALALGKKL